MGLEEECEHYASPAEGVAVVEKEQGQILPWSGLALGLSDLFPVVSLGRPQVVGMVGAANSGKTTLLAAHWVCARRGIGDFGKKFAGSYTLSGWHQIARHLQWIPYGTGFPPHTAAVDERSPALLHATYDHNRIRRQVLFTDGPGEWFTRWAEEPGAVEGAQWVADQSDVFVLLADSEALCGQERGRGRAEYETLALQLHTAARGRPVIPVLSKADLNVPTPIVEFVEELNSRLFKRKTLRISASDGAVEPITAPVDLGVQLVLTDRFAPIASVSGQWAAQLAPTLPVPPREYL
ncbi:GTPase domain-containing protein [Rhodococcoides fascians]|uniref:GTPase domain-containing protein n=2 Tax=Rhodococcoides fascians TaxID=1828 RepID=UPI001E613ED3|nr:GTPase domain-containing protein [Rhodococcus fascians]